MQTPSLPLLEPVPLVDTTTVLLLLSLVVVTMVPCRAASNGSGAKNGANSLLQNIKYKVQRK